MKLPALCLAATFAGGVALGLFSPLVNFSTSVQANRGFLLGADAACCVLDSPAPEPDCFGCDSFSRSVAQLGRDCAWCASQPGPENHVLSLAAAGRLDYSTPLRWHARLRDEPAELPWGVSYDLVLNSVEFEGITIRTTGGMRLSYSPHGDSLQLRALHAGDEISFVAQAIHILTDGNSLEISCFLDCSRTVSTKDSVPAQPPNHQQEN